MDILEKNIKLKTNGTTLHYGELETNTHLLIGCIDSSLPFTFTLVGDQEPLIPIQNGLLDELLQLYRIFVNIQFSSSNVSDLQVVLEGTDLDVTLRIWKPYPISQPIQVPSP